jgi:predicted GH43/DUF377 family glycosyl hydrolase
MFGYLFKRVYKNKRMIMKKIILLSASLFSVIILNCRNVEPPTVESLTFSYTKVKGIGQESGIVRRDPSDVIKIENHYYVWYTRVDYNNLEEKFMHLKPSGYPGRLWYAKSVDGVNWTEQGQALGVGETGAWDSFGVFTPNILNYQGRYWLYYTGVMPTPGRDDGVFENNSTNDYTAIGLAVSDSPDGPFKRVSSNPILETNREEPESFDSYRVDDACLLVRDGKIWLYFKGRSLSHGRTGPRSTKMGLAIADKPEGPYTKQNNGEPVQDSGHEVQICKSYENVMSLVSPTGPQGKSIQIAPDGIHFQVILSGLQHQPGAPGVYRPELTDPSAQTGFAEWGLSHGRPGPYLQRFDCEWSFK